LGAAMAGLDKEKMEVLGQIGENLGLVFQIGDDILGLFGDPEITGKSNTSDIAEGKRTILMKKLHQALSLNQQEKLEIILNKGSVSGAEVSWVKNLLVEKNIKQEAMETSHKLVLESSQLLEQNFEPNEATEFIQGLGQYLLTRDK